MIVICTHKSPEILKRIVSSIRKNSKEEHKILLVETSDNKISKSVAEEYNCLFTNTDLKYEIGAYKHAIEFFPNENEYFMFQDSLEIINTGWEDAYRQLSQDVKMVALCGYPLAEDPCPGCGKVFFESTYQLNFPVDKALAVGCNCFYIPQKGKRLIKEFGFDKIKAENKVDTYDTERIIGAVAHSSCGIEDVSKILGNWVWERSHYRHNCGFTECIYKHMQYRQ